MTEARAVRCPTKPMQARRIPRVLVWCVVLCALIATPARAQKVLIPMDLTQTDHLKAYGVAYWTLEHGLEVDWLLNYRGGSFLIDHSGPLERECRVRGVTFQIVGAAEIAQIYTEIEGANMDVVLLEKAPAVAVYTPPNKQPWDDAVTMALVYAEIRYDTLWDPEVLQGKLEDYDWLHLHHEDFSGQYGKFFASQANTRWYIEQQIQYEEVARQLGFEKVSEEKKALARAIRDYVVRGGFLFAMCSATDTFDIALAAANTDIADYRFDGDPADPGAQDRLDYSRCLAFSGFRLEMNPLIYEYSDIDYPHSAQPLPFSPESDYFGLFEFSAKYDPVPTMLTQNHVSVVRGFMGQTTGYHRDRVKKSVIIMGEVENTPLVKYIHGSAGSGTFTFLGGHDPEDYMHHVGDPPTQLELHKNSPGYRLILNNLLFPAAKKKERKT